jgi:SAM-dependent methyltransferase
MNDEPPPDHVTLNRAAWDVRSVEYAEPGREAWASDEVRWGTWHVPDADLHLLPDVKGLDTIELGCGTAYVSAWLARRGARPVGIDISPRQLETARELQREHGIDFPLLLGNAETVPLPDAGFDLAISEYGAALWCDPYKWIPEASRLLRSGGWLIFLTNGTILTLCEKDDEDVPVDAVLRRQYFGLHRTEWSDDHVVEFHLGYGDWIRLLRANGFEVENLVEVRPPEGATTRYPYVDISWARRWPSEEAWIARKR